MRQVVYYAIGGGLGHLTRGRAVLEQLGLARNATILSASPHATDPRVNGGIAVEAPPGDVVGGDEGYRRWLASTLERLAPDHLLVDTFPEGLFGELRSSNVPATLIARKLRWSVYTEALGRTAKITFDSVRTIEPLSPEYHDWLEAHSSRVEELEVHFSPHSPPHDLPVPFWLVAHSGPPEETRELVAYASEQKDVEGFEGPIVVATLEPASFPGARLVIDRYPIRGDFVVADRVFTACGFNSMREMAGLRERHRFIPFARRFDDQYARAAEARVGELVRDA